MNVLHTRLLKSTVTIVKSHDLRYKSTVNTINYQLEKNYQQYTTRTNCRALYL